MINIRKLESELWESADLLRSGSPLISNQYCMPVLGLIFLYVMPSEEFMSIFSISFQKVLLQMMVCFLRRNPL